MATISISLPPSGIYKKRYKAIKFIKLAKQAGIYRFPLKSLSDNNPENTVPIIPHIELIEINPLASTIE